MKKIAAAILASWLALCGAAVAQTALYSHAATSALAASLVVDSNPLHTLAYANCSGITGGAAGYCIAYNSATVPAGGALTGALVLDACYFGTTPQGCTLNHIPGNFTFSGGIVILISSAASPYTYTTGTDTGLISADYN